MGLDGVGAVCRGAGVPVPSGVPRQALYRLNHRLSSKGERSEVEQAVTAGNPVIWWLNSFLSLVSH